MYAPLRRPVLSVRAAARLSVCHRYPLSSVSRLHTGAKRARPCLWTFCARVPVVLSAAAFRLALVDELGMIGGREKGWVRMYLKFDKF